MRTSQALFASGSGILAVALVASSCGGSTSAGSPTTPSPTPAAGTTVSIVGNQGNQSFSPNPAPVSQGALVSWRNTDSQTHRIVLNDGSLDTGNIAPGSTSMALTLGTNGANYHCSIHPTMVGSINSSTGAPPPCTGIYCSSAR